MSNISILISDTSTIHSDNVSRLVSQSLGVLSQDRPSNQTDFDSRSLVNPRFTDDSCSKSNVGYIKHLKIPITEMLAAMIMAASHVSRDYVPTSGIPIVATVPKRTPRVLTTVPPISPQDLWSEFEFIEEHQRFFQNAHANNHDDR